MSSFRNPPKIARRKLADVPESETKLSDPIEDVPTFSQVEKAVLALSPILALLSGYITSWVGTHFPGISINPSQTTTLFVAGIAVVVLVVLKFMHSKDAAVRLGVSRFLQSAEHFTTGEIGKLPEGLMYEEDVKALIEEHLPSVKAELDRRLPELEKSLESRLPPVVAQALGNLFKEASAAGVPIAPEPEPEPTPEPEPVAAAVAPEPHKAEAVPAHQWPEAPAKPAWPTPQQGQPTGTPGVTTTEGAATTGAGQ